MDTIHEIFMKEALAMAQKALDASEVPAGCTLSRDGVIVAKASNRTKKAERRAQECYSARGAGGH
ncbi:uncharacterized protein ARMOST_21937 [Armillaria ostoyae]|uniref:CMP/dCMP-type deaminase domain-containing protein n=1 Tax=Armillaria ostoyae TaxID=47428 RepID=A0A284SBF3_ARMOS|nr:uncharacterized protein ARMOST_21937 [Armillaria ostoyae]